VHAEHGVDRGPERLGGVDHDQHALLDIQTAVDEVGQQVPSRPSCSRSSLPGPSGIFTP